MTSTTVHVPILLEPIVQALVDPLLRLPESSPSYWIVDCTLGGGGHCSALLDALNTQEKLQKHKVLALDQDESAVQRAKERFKDEISAGRLEILHQRFSDAKEQVSSRPVIGLMADLGFSSDQLENPERGLSFQNSGPLDMRLDPSRGMSCREYLDQISESELEKVLRELGEERFSRRIASSIVYLRSQGRLPSTTQQLVDAVVRAVPPGARHGRIHVATRTFQALRIAVNDELSELDELLNHVIRYIMPGGRIAILSFHSLEDRRVKQEFKDRDRYIPLTKKPIQADEAEIRRNPRARSAKLRIAEIKSSEGV